jgi:hypothetical protein
MVVMSMSSRASERFRTTPNYQKIFDPAFALVTVVRRQGLEPRTR